MCPDCWNDKCNTTLIITSATWHHRKANPDFNLRSAHDGKFSPDELKQEFPKNMDGGDVRPDREINVEICQMDSRWMERVWGV